VEDAWVVVKCNEYGDHVVLKHGCWSRRGGRQVKCEQVRLRWSFRKVCGCLIAKITWGGADLLSDLTSSTHGADADFIPRAGAESKTVRLRVRFLKHMHWCSGQS
jgi:hypothetical protein